MNSGTASQEHSTEERRSGRDRRQRARRGMDERRKRARRISRSNVDLDSRLSGDRRGDQRRGMYDRRGRLGRRTTDRRRETPAAFSREDTARIRQMVENQPPVVVCPICFRRLPVERPDAVKGTEIFEIRCTDCNRTAMITRTAGKRILMVVDNAIVRDALSLVLQRAGHAVSEADDVKTAVEMFRDSAPDVVVVDLELPRSAGPSLIRQFAAGRPRTCFLALASKRRIGMPDPAVAVKGFGRVEIIRKPVSPPALLEVMDKALA